MHVYKQSMTCILPQKRRIRFPVSDSRGSRLQHTGTSWQRTKFTANQTPRRNVTIRLSYDHSCNIPTQYRVTHPLRPEILSAIQSKPHKSKIHNEQLTPVLVINLHKQSLEAYTAKLTPRNTQSKNKKERLLTILACNLRNHTLCLPLSPPLLPHPNPLSSDHPQLPQKANKKAD
ncbi:hypothetical protein COCSADRAFT_309294 [Bipolaris sorokiniana ND90Pr]|uniref:Uncharacterized protein n=1 Tax=Cochliobolus sativus (strain ND90Pr / ATCC 201652) TaxID=665912 RepID=M2SEN7_COCSN|nr:uncharacterized protein COCSADRAFT_309294 [Bipolaris sorokiniana ND90Pr]EMD65748.1 hypothetical protein COCSADRAFT_309294 [Bipolaris sorokiniana ND90Pr]